MGAFDQIYYGNLLEVLEEDYTFGSKRNCTLLQLSKPNAKINHWQLNLPSGHTCPFADKCLGKVNRKTGKLEEPEKGEDDYRCYAASLEALRKDAARLRFNNFDLLLSKKTKDEMSELIVNSINNQLPRSEKVFRLHEGGDFFNQTYFDAWVETANHYSGDIVFYAYTKSLTYWVNRLNNIPENLRLIASYGGKKDDLIEKYNLVFSVTVFSEEEAANYPLSPYWQEKLGREKGIPIDHDDSHAVKADEPFCTLLHGQQPKGSKASEALKKLGGMGGKSSYSMKKKLGVG
jgi:hypothetical protein